MKNCAIKIETPRGTFNMTIVFDTMEEARESGYGLWFQHENYLILAKNNRVHACVEVTK